LLSERPHQWEHEQNCQNADKYLFWFHDAFCVIFLKPDMTFIPHFQTSQEERSSPKGLTAFLGCSHIEMGRHQSSGNNGDVAVIMRPAISDVEFSRLSELALVLVRFNHVAGLIVNANHGIM
jgi:hypothetical protein